MAEQIQRDLIGYRYEIKNFVGQGAFGTVYHAVDKLTGQDVALKRLPVSAANDPNTLYETSLALANEFQFLAGLRHPNIISVLNYGFDQDQHPYLVTELLQ